MPSYQKKPCMGAECPGCPSCYSKGGKVKGVHEPQWSRPGESTTGYHVREVNDEKRYGSKEDRIRGGNEEHHLGMAKDKHKKVLSELKSMKKPELMAHGGGVDDIHSSEIDVVRNKEKLRRISDKEQKGVHIQTSDPKASAGTSGPGQSLRFGHKNDAIIMHKRTLSEMKSMKKPNLYTEGGEVEGDEELHHAMGGELMDALEKKDRKGIMSAMEAIVLSMKGKHE